MKYLFKRDTLLATVSVFIVMGLLSLIPLNMHVLDPLKLALTDISFNDLSFSVLKNHRNNAIDEKIVIVNIGSADRSEIASVVKKINAAQPKTIGLDVLFLSPGIPAADSALAAAITDAPGIVLSNKLYFESDGIRHDNFFSAASKYSGYVNFVGENSGVIRYFSPFEKVRDSVTYSFAAAVIKVSDELKFRSLRERSNDLEFINYQRQADQYLIFDYHDLLGNKVNPSVFNNKIVLVGFVDNNPNNIEDKHFTPLNEKFSGRSTPDMNGVVIHANIISMILENRYIIRSPAWFNWFLAFMLTWVFSAFLIQYYIKHHIWYHLVLKIIQLLLSVVFIYLGILFGKYLNVYLNLSVTLVAIIISVDVLYFYEAFAKWAHKKYGFRSLFSKARHK
jgi:CHASE2 domain-containing sensor protein